MKMKNKDNVTKWSRAINFMAIIIAIYLFIESVFSKQIINSGYFFYSAILGVLMIIVGILSFIMYYITKRKSK